MSLQVSLDRTDIAFKIRTDSKTCLRSTQLQFPFPKLLSQRTQRPRILSLSTSLAHKTRVATHACRKSRIDRGGMGVAADFESVLWTRPEGSIAGHSKRVHSFERERRILDAPLDLIDATFDASVNGSRS